MSAVRVQPNPGPWCAMCQHHHPTGRAFPTRDQRPAAVVNSELGEGWYDDDEDGDHDAH